MRPARAGTNGRMDIPHNGSRGDREKADDEAPGLASIERPADDPQTRPALDPEVGPDESETREDT